LQNCTEAENLKMSIWARCWRIQLKRCETRHFMQVKNLKMAVLRFGRSKFKNRPKIDFGSTSKYMVKIINAICVA